MLTFWPPGPELRSVGKLELRVGNLNMRSDDKHGANLNGTMAGKNVARGAAKRSL
ncbi:MAG: hypothetical protein QM775_16360 [Pirellulales bacterium]